MWDSSSRRCWERLHGYYGSSLTEKFGVTPPREWCECIDDLTNDQIKRALSIIRTEHPGFPPALPEFERAAKPPDKPVVDQGPTVQQRLCEFILANKTLTQKQLSSPWKYLYREWITQEWRGKELKEVKNCECVGVEISADGESPSYRVMVVDMGLSEAA